MVKDDLGDITDNYRAIKASSQILKLLDIVILMLEGEKLGCDEWQLGFQEIQAQQCVPGQSLLSLTTIIARELL